MVTKAKYAVLATRFGALRARVKLGMVAAAALWIAAGVPAMAATSGITALDGVKGVVVGIVQVIAVIFFLILVSLAGVEFAKARNIIVMIAELAGAILSGVIAFNAQTLLQMVGMAGAHF